MLRPGKTVDRRVDVLAGDLLTFCDDQTALNACTAFLTQALASALVSGGGLDERSATGAVFCAQWLNDRMGEHEQQLKKILAQAHGSGGAGGS